MLDPHDRWLWDFWHVQEGDTHHLFYLQAARSLGDPELRHRNATVGHATSTDLIDWTEHGTVLQPGRAGAIDETATWTGSIVRGDDGLWRMFYTGSVFPNPATTTNVEGITVAVSDDLHTWRKDTSLRLHADSAWYERLGDSEWPEEAWRDPWVQPSATGGWDMLVTARSHTGELMERGVVGLAHSLDLHRWTIAAPLTSPGHGFAQLEVLQTVEVHGHRFLLFSTHERTISAHRRAAGQGTGVWAAPIDDRDIRLDSAYMLTDAALYSGRIVERDGDPVLLAFRNEGEDGVFLGGIVDPIPVKLEGDRIVLSMHAAHTHR